MAARLFRLRAVVAAGLIAGLLLSPKLWVSTRFYPLTPVMQFLKPLPYPFDYAVYVLLLALCGDLGGRAVRARSVAIATLVLSIRVQADQHADALERCAEAQPVLCRPARLPGWRTHFPAVSRLKAGYAAPFVEAPARFSGGPRDFTGWP